jgi:NAD(P)-dependent dehydrogenase (short-subunit alcohol dehydrogenase family)
MIKGGHRSLRAAGCLEQGFGYGLERAAWDYVLATNLSGVFLCTKHAASVMSQQRSGSIINLASLYALMGPSKGLLGAYTAAKHGVIGLTRANSIELAPLGIRVNAIAPGWHQTEMTAWMRDTHMSVPLVGSLFRCLGPHSGQRGGCNSAPPAASLRPAPVQAVPMQVVPLPVPMAPLQVAGLFSPTAPRLIRPGPRQTANTKLSQEPRAASQPPPR